MSLAVKAILPSDDIFETEALKKDALAFFRQNKLGGKPKIGNMGKWGYSSHYCDGDPVRGGILWDLFVIIHGSYYPKRNQVPLFQNNLKWLRGLIGTVDGVLDFGCGGDQSIDSGAIPLLRVFSEASFYMPIDTCAQYVVSAGAKVAEVFGDGIRVIPHHGDFTRPIENIPFGNKLGLFLGSSTNFENFPDDMRSLLRDFRRAVGKGGHLAMLFDTNTDAASVINSYDHPLHEQMEINLIWRLKRDLNITGDLDPASWKYKTDTETFRFGEHTVLVGHHVLVPMRPQSFFIDDEHVWLEEGENLVSDKSFKVPVALMDELAAEEGYASLGVRYDHQDRLAFPVYAVN